MNTPAQILSGLAAAGAIALFPLTSRFSEASALEETAARQAKTRALAAPAGVAEAGAAGGAPAVSNAGRIPPGVSAAEASQTVLELAALDGKMLSSRQIVAILEKVMNLPASHMEEARAVIQNSKNPVIGAFLYSGLFARWGELDPEAARTALEAGTGGNPILKFAGAASLAGGWMEKDPDSLIKWLTEEKEGLTAQEKELRSTMMNGILGGMAEVDNAMAERLIAAAPKDRRPWMIMDMAERDPSIDPREAAARALAEAGDDEGQRSSINWRVGRMLADRDPMEAIRYAEEQPEKERGQTYEAALSSWLQKDEKEAMKWLKEQPENVQTDAVKGMRGQLKDMSYDEVAKLTTEVTPAAANNLWKISLDQTANKDPEAALQYLPNISESDRPNSYREIAQSWTKKDPEAASSWIDPLPPGKEKDQAISGMVGELKSKEPDSSTIWASTISDENLRERLVNENAKIWLRRDRAAAEEWIQSSETLTDEQRAKLLEGK